MEVEKRIVSLVPYKILPAHTGGQRGIAIFNQHLGREVNLTCVSVKSNDTDLATTYKLLPLLSDSPLRYINIFSFFSLRKIIKQTKATSIIVEHPYFGWLGWLIKCFCSVKLVVHTHNIEHLRFQSLGKVWWRILKLYERWVFKRADIIFCISEEDRQVIINKLGIPASKCVIVPYGISRNNKPVEKEQIKNTVCKELSIDPSVTLLFFNGALNYKPNTDALDAILHHINPLLLNKNYNYRIMISGKYLPEYYKELKDWKDKNVIYLGFVDDIDRYTIAADILLNAVTSGGGIKTKVVEALAMNTTVISTINGATGVSEIVCGGKLILTPDNDWTTFAEKTYQASVTPPPHIPDEFYNFFNWSSIIKRIIQYL